MINLGVLGSTKGTDLQVIIDAISEKKLNAKIAVVISNNSDAFILRRAKNHDIPAKFISHKSKERHLFDSEITLILKKHKVDLVLLIRFMRILSSEFCKEWKIEDYSVTYNMGRWKSHEHFHVKIKTKENVIKRLRSNHFKFIKKNKRYNNADYIKK